MASNRQISLFMDGRPFVDGNPSDDGRPAVEEGDEADLARGSCGGRSPALGPDLLIQWQGRVVRHQRGVSLGEGDGAPGQLALLQAPQQEGTPVSAAAIDPLGLTPQSLQFWRWPVAPHQGAAIYFVVDRPPHLEDPLLLYVGETGRADRRWKGEHDCKSYLAAYGEALQSAGLETRLSIRFWCDAPRQVRPRRNLEQALIRRWWPPFNKETRDRWATPFLNDVA